MLWTTQSSVARLSAVIMTGGEPFISGALENGLSALSRPDFLGALPMDDSNEAIAHLRQAFEQGKLTLYLGAGVSVANGLPKWDELVLAMYFNVLSKHLYDWQLAPHYLFAVAKWYRDRTDESLEISAQKIYLHYKNENEFLADLRKTLYFNNGNLVRDDIRSANSTLDAVARLCEADLDVADRGVQSVITYNFDCCLEVAMDDLSVQPVFGAAPLKPGKLPIYHVHGFIPPVGEGSSMKQIVFTEDQYHLASQNADLWSNLVQISCLSSTVGLMVGLSLSDRNMRRLSKAITRTSLRSNQYALLRRPKSNDPDEDALENISQNALDYLKKGGSKNVGSSTDEIWKKQVNDIIQGVEEQSVSQNTRVLKELGITPIWYDDHADIAKIVTSILPDRRK